MTVQEGGDTRTALVLRHVRLPGSLGTTSVTIVGGTVAGIGDDAPSAGPGVEHRDAAGATLLPGLWDAHVHLDEWAIARRRLDLAGARSARDVADAVAAAARAGGTEAIGGYGFQYALWDDPPHKDRLQAAAPDRVVVLASHDLHTAWLSPAALARIGRGDHETGVLLEADCYEALRLLREHDEADVDRWVDEAVREAAALGVTGIIDFEIGDSSLAWQRRTSGRAPQARIVCTVYAQHLDAALARGLPSGADVPGAGGLVSVGPLKLFVDGSLNSRTALCHDPYPGLLGTDRSHGLLETPPDELAALLRRAMAGGLSAAVHAIGDRANSLALDAFEATGCPGRIEHGQLLAADDVERAARLGLTIGIQPAHLLDDRDVADVHWAGRTHRAFPYADLVRAGVNLEIGSDAPVSPLDPWRGIAAAVSRTIDEREPWHPEQRIAVADALAASTRGRRGIRPGEPADLVLVDRDPLAIDPMELTDVAVLGTVVGGTWTHGG